MAPDQPLPGVNRPQEPFALIKKVEKLYLASRTFSISVSMAYFTLMVPFFAVMMLQKGRICFGWILK